MNLRLLIHHRLIRALWPVLVVSALGAILWGTDLGGAWVRASYDSLFRFGSRGVTNSLVLIKMDNASYDALRMTRGNWDRAIHADLLNRLTADGCRLVVFDVFFGGPTSASSDKALADALRQNGKTLLVQKLEEVTQPGAVVINLPPIYEPIGKWAEQGIGRVDPDTDGVVRRHYPFPAPSSSFESLPWVAARRMGAALPVSPTRQWLRYYRDGEGWQEYSYSVARVKERGFFTNAIVFIANEPADANPAVPEKDKFLRPNSVGRKQVVGGVEILATQYLNLLNGDWLCRPEALLELLGILGFGCVLGLGCSGRVIWRYGGPLLIALIVFVGSIYLSQFTKYWVPWCVVVGGQAPCALAIGWFNRKQFAQQTEPIGTAVVSREPRAVAEVPATGRAQEIAGAAEPPNAPDYVFVAPPFGEGAFGKVWLVRNAIGQWQALKTVHRAKFGDNPKPYEAEFQGIQHYKPISNQHLGLLTIDFVSNPRAEGYFYYVMELGDACEAGWESRPETYRPLDLHTACQRQEMKRLTPSECVRIGIQLADALAFLHDRNLAHRDIKPGNIIFVQGQPKLADIGLVAGARRPEDISTFVGTIGYMPPPPEPPGTKQADVYALGMVLYVISTGRQPLLYPELKTSLVMETVHADFMFLNHVIIRACDPDLKWRYPSARELKGALEEAAKKISSLG